MAKQEVVTAFTEEQVSRLTGISIGQLRYWDRTDFFEPEFAHEQRREAYSRLYSYIDLVSLKVIARLRKEIPLQQLRLVRDRLGTIDPSFWRGTTLWVHRNRVAFVHPESGEPEEVVSGQMLIKLPLRDFTDDLDKGLRTLRERDRTTLGTVAKHKRIMRNRPVIAGTRIPVSAVRSFHMAGYSVEQILLEYPSLTPEDVEAALADDRAA